MTDDEELFGHANPDWQSWRTYTAEEEAEEERFRQKMKKVSKK